MATFTPSTIDLSMTDSLGTQLTATVYHLNGIENADGSSTDLSIGQLVMAICLTRATKLEEEIVSQLAALALTTSQLEVLSTLEEQLVSKEDSSSSSTYSTFDFTWDVGFTYTENNKEVKLYKSYSTTNGTYTYSCADVLKYFGISISTGATWSDVISEVESKMDSLNSLSQTTLIDIQSLTSKRDDTYNLVSNVLKSFYTEMLGNVNNM